MKNRMFKVGTVVPKLKVADIEYNQEQIISHIVSNQECSILVFPELCITGYTCADLFTQNIVLESAQQALLKISESTSKGQVAVVGLPLVYENDLYNVAAFISDGKVIGIVPKKNIPNYSEFYERRWFKSGFHISDKTVKIGNQMIPFGMDILISDPVTGVKIGTDICEDLWVADKPSTHACLAGANVIVNLSASDELIGKDEYRRSLVSQQSATCYCAYLYTSSGVGESSTDLVFSGHSMIVQNGKILSDSLFSDQAVHTAVIDLDILEYNRLKQNTYTNEMNCEYRNIEVHVAPLDDKLEVTVDELALLLRKENYVVDPNPFIPSDKEECIHRCRKILTIQANGLATRVKATGIYNLVIGISGGLDSTLALIVCHEAKKLVPEIKLITYTMPSRGNTTSRTYCNAISLMKLLGDEIREVPIEESVKLHLQEIGHHGDYQGECDITYENAQARMRTYILMDAANLHHGFVVGTGDLSELALGWCTYNGDHMSMYGVNTSVPKTLVQYICRSYANACGDEVLRNTLLSICDTPISPELTPNSSDQISQKTEEKIGKYDLNDFFLFYTLRYGMNPEKIMAFALCAYPELEKNFVKQAELRFFKRFFQQQFKRSCLPDGPKIGSVSLSPRGDWRMPSDASVALWLNMIEKA